MAGLFGLLTSDDSDSAYANQVGQGLVYDAINQYVDQINADMAAAMQVFVEGPTEMFAERYKMPGGGRLQQRGLQSRTAAVKASGGWDVAYPINDFGAQIAGSDVDLAYMTIGDIERHVTTVEIQNVNTVRYEILRRLFKNTTDTFVDPLPLSSTPTLTIQPLANGDSVVYPPLEGSESEATENLYLESGYAASSISDTNNPIKTIVRKLTQRFGNPAGGANIVVFIHYDQTAKVSDLSGFTDVPDNFLALGDNVTVPTRLPSVPGRIIGRCDGAWISEWDWIPTGYMVGVHLEAPAPLKIRYDLAATGLPRGLALVASDFDYPLQSAEWRHRFGVGVGNRLNGVVMELGTGGTYTIPSAYT